VEALLKENDRLEGFLSESPLTPPQRHLRKARFERGARLGRYTIVEPMGHGGMGEVYRATDSSLGRDVAIKLVHSELDGSSELVVRFQREARALAALNHPNICTIYEIGEQDGGVFIAMELLEGRSLRQRIGGKPLALETALALSIQIADALFAHQPQVGLMNQCRRLQRMIRPLAAHIGLGDAAQLLIDERKQLLAGRSIAGIHRFEQPRDLSRSGIHDIDLVRIVLRKPTLVGG
jgi:serine/threonine protein kinase